MYTLSLSIASLQSCHPSVAIHTLCSTCSILTLSLQSLGSSAGPRAYPHNIRLHKIHPFINLWHLCKGLAYVGALTSIHTLCSISSILIISLQSLCPLAGLRAFPHHIRSHTVHHLIDLFHLCKAAAHLWHIHIV